MSRRSGCRQQRLAFDFNVYDDEESHPWFTDITAYRDLWKISESKAFTKALLFIEEDNSFEKWEELLIADESAAKNPSLLREQTELETDDEKTIQNITTTEHTFDVVMMVPPSDGSKYNVKLFSHHALVSNIGNKMGYRYDSLINFAVGYEPPTDKYRLHTRTSSPSSCIIDLSVTIMKKFPNGGGHHPKAGPCTIPNGSSFRIFFILLNIFEIKKFFIIFKIKYMKILHQDV